MNELKKGPLISVIVANYNKAEYLSECLDSVLKQSFDNLEIIVFDDCSLDHSRSILRQYEKRNPDRVSVIYSLKNVGVAIARNMAMIRSKGKYITTLDSDDYFVDSNKLKREMALVEKYEKAGLSVAAFSNIIMVNETGQFLGFQWPHEKIIEGDIFEKILTRSCMIPRDFVILKDVVLKIGGYDERLMIYEDWDLKIRIAKNCNFFYTGKDGTAYRQNGRGLSSFPIPVHIKYLKKIFNKNQGLIKRAVRNKIQTDFKYNLKRLRKQSN